MGNATADQLDAFYDLSVELTGFDKIDLIGTGVGHGLYDKLVRRTGDENVEALLAEAQKARSSQKALRNIVEHKQFGPMAKNIILMWYLGSWYRIPEEWYKSFGAGVEVETAGEEVVSAEAYKEALWAVAVGAHARGANPPGFGSWAEAPLHGKHDSQWGSESGQRKKQSGQKRTSKKRASQKRLSKQKTRK